PLLRYAHARARARGDRDRRHRGGRLDAGGAVGGDRPALGRQPHPERLERESMSDLITTRSPSLDQALEMLAAARSAAEQEGIALAAAVVDAGGHVIASQRMDGAALGAAVLANDKAYTAVLWGVRTGDFMESTQPGGADWAFPSTSGGRIVVYAGGVPLYRD